MSTPRVLQVVLQLDPGGTERLVVELVKRLHPQIPMAVCCLDAPGAWALQLESLGVPVVALHRAPGFHPSLALRVAKVARAHGANVLHCHHYSPFVYGRLAALTIPGCRVVYTEHGRLADDPPSWKRRLVNRALTVGVHELIAVSHDLRAHLLREAMPTRTRVVWNGIDVGEAPSAEKRKAARAALSLPDDARVVMTIARLDPVKDLATLIQAVRLARVTLPALHLVVIGEGPERQHLARVAEAEGVASAVHFIGHREDARQLLHGANLYVNSSTSEGISLTILEAMAAGLPVAATAVGGTPEVVAGGETGVLVPPHDAVRLSMVMGELSRETEYVRTMADAARHRVASAFDVTDMVAAYERLYAKCGSIM